MTSTCVRDGACSQVALYDGEVARAHRQLDAELLVLKEEKERVVHEAFVRAESQMKAVHDNLAGQRACARHAIHRPSVRPDAPANEGCSRVAASGVRSKLAGLHPALRTLTSDYNTLKKQVHHFPAMLHDAIDDAKREVGATAQGGRHVTNLFAITRLGFAVQGSWIWFFFLSGFFFSVCFWGW